MRVLLVLALLFTGSALRAQSDPVFYWALDEYTGITAYDWAGEAHGTLQGNTEWLPEGGHLGGALNFYGGGARVDAGPCDITTGSGDQITLSCWFLPEVMVGTERMLIAKTIGPDDFVWSLSLANTTGARFRVRANGTVYTIDVQNMNLFGGMWYNLCGVYDGNSMMLYVNGSLIASGAASGLIGFHPQAPTTMGDLVDSSAPYTGILDDVRVFDHALSQEQIYDLVLGDVATSVNEANLLTSQAGIAIDEQNHLQLPNGAWNELRVMDTCGKLIRRSRITGTAALDLSPNAPGLYLVCLQGDGTSITRPVLVR